jgi:hypothetical protein
MVAYHEVDELHFACVVRQVAPGPHPLDNPELVEVKG